MNDYLTMTTVDFVMPTRHRFVGAAISCPLPVDGGLRGWRVETDQDLATVDRGADVTQKFSTRLGPPPRRWPV